MGFMEPWRKNLYVIWGAQFLAMAGMSMAMPFMPFYIRSLGVADLASVKRWSGAVFAGPFFVSVFMAPVWGLVSDRVGPLMGGTLSSYVGILLLLPRSSFRVHRYFLYSGFTRFSGAWPVSTRRHSHAVLV